MATLHDIHQQADTPPHRLVQDADTPAGCSLATVRMVGVVTTYLLDAGGGILGRVEWSPLSSSVEPLAYAGTGVKGGIWLGPWRGAGAAFQAMAGVG